MQDLVKYIRLFSQHGKLVTLPQVAAVIGLEEEPEDEDVVGQYVQLILAPEYADICMRKSADEHYFFSRKHIVDSYANRWLAIRRGEVLPTLVQQIREASCQHNAVVEESILNYKPYALDSEGREALREQLAADPECCDIAYAKTAQGEGYFYSTRGLNAGYAKVLANYDPNEWSC
ncbi:hypothetical protein [Shewanella fodinae]|uniref:Uncharacterized protein n=1 Tax=Shewanella fodinae TaxID=552357 RepID=A0A4R2FF51_9GAMM|nr:hypothetical protein [Shewanella fodinae]TCN84641.1 hypothetical protein EDC91_11155 [Shewanella fodinae]